MVERTVLKHAREISHRYVHQNTFFDAVREYLGQELAKKYFPIYRKEFFEMVKPILDDVKRIYSSVMVSKKLGRDATPIIVGSNVPEPMIRDAFRLVEENIAGLWDPKYMYSSGTDIYIPVSRRLERFLRKYLGPEVGKKIRSDTERVYAEDLGVDEETARHVVELVYHNRQDAIRLLERWGLVRSLFFREEVRDLIRKGRLNVNTLEKLAEKRHILPLLKYVNEPITEKTLDILDKIHEHPAGGRLLYNLSLLHALPEDMLNKFLESVETHHLDVIRDASDVRKFLKLREMNHDDDTILLALKHEVPEDLYPHLADPWVRENIRKGKDHHLIKRVITSGHTHLSRDTLLRLYEKFDTSIEEYLHKLDEESARKLLESPISDLKGAIFMLEHNIPLKPEYQEVARRLIEGGVHPSLVKLYVEKGVNPHMLKNVSPEKLKNIRYYITEDSTREEIERYLNQEVKIIKRGSRKEKSISLPAEEYAKMIYSSSTIKPDGTIVVRGSNIPKVLRKKKSMSHEELRELLFEYLKEKMGKEYAREVVHHLNKLLKEHMEKLPRGAEKPKNTKTSDINPNVVRSYLRSLKKAVKKNYISKLEEGEYVVLTLKKDSHESVLLRDINFHKLLKRIGDALNIENPVIKESHRRIKIHKKVYDYLLSFIKEKNDHRK